MKPTKELLTGLFGAYLGSRCEVTTPRFTGVVEWVDIRHMEVGLISKVEYESNSTDPYLHKDDLEDCSLLLRPIESLTEEERFHIYNTSFVYKPIKLSEFTEENRRDLKFKMYDWEEEGFPSEIVDYLRSIGVATDYMGGTVEEQIKANVIKIIE